ncbi:MAG: hypothetical protein GWP08_18610 [Nitrospiraceae bacterium]|nr:hypothetical protein [Nitrospiraceae bacterium]
MTRLPILLFLLPATVLAAGIGTASYPPAQPILGTQQRSAHTTALKVTGSALVACAVADVITTEFGRGVESNPIIPTRANGKPQAWVYVARIGGTAAFAAGQWLLVKHTRNRKLTTAFTVLNGVLAGRSCAVAVQNAGVK